MAYVYVLRSKKDNNRYIGSTIDLDHRLAQHNAGHVKSTKHRRPLELIGYQLFGSIEEAAKCESIYKKSNGALQRSIKTGAFVVVNGV